MNTAPQGILTTVARLRAVLEETATALAAADLDRLLAGDTALQDALFAVPVATGGFRLQTEDPEERALIRRELEGVADALRRCRRLGVGLSDFVRLSLEARGGQLGYEHDPNAAAAALAGRGLTVRV